MPRSDPGNVVRGYLTDWRLPELLEWAKATPSALRVLTTFIYETDELIRWRAIAVIGRVAASEAQRDVESVREIIRRLLWSMNDDSGSVGWHAPEAIGEIIANVPNLIEEYGLILASFMGKAPFERGAHWAVARLATIRPDVFSDLANDLVKSLDADDPYLRAYAARALLSLDAKMAAGKLEEMSNDPAEIVVFNSKSGELKKVSLDSLILLTP